MPPCKWRVTERSMLQAWLQLALDAMRTNAANVADLKTRSQLVRAHTTALEHVRRMLPAPRPPAAVPDQRA